VKIYEVHVNVVVLNRDGTNVIIVTTQTYAHSQQTELASGFIPGDKDVAEWMHPLESYHCAYVRAWVTVKHYSD